MQPRDSVHYNQCGKCMARSEKVSRTCTCASSHISVSPSSTPTHCCCCFEKFRQHAPEASKCASCRPNAQQLPPIQKVDSACRRTTGTRKVARRLLDSKKPSPRAVGGRQGHTTLLLPRRRQERAAHRSSPRCPMYDESCCAHTVCLGDTLVVCGRVGFGGSQG
jgi:hypothetical protein